MTNIVHGGMIPGDYSNASTDMELDARKLLASEPKFHRGMDTPMRREASRTITYSWTVGEGDMWKQTVGPNERVTFRAVLTITHNKKGHRGAAHYSAVLWQHHVDAHGAEGVLFDAHNGLHVLMDTAGAGRYSAAKLAAFAKYALGQLQGPKANDERVLRYFAPERI
jgi:hypothetical protein